MKKISFACILSIILVFNTCSSSGENNPDGKTTVVKEGEVTTLTADMFRKLVWDYQKNPDSFVFSGDVPVIVDFYAVWCRPCKIVSPIMEDLAKEYKGKIKIYKVDTDAERELAGLFKIQSIPSILFVPKNGKPSISVGASPKETYVQAIKDVLQVK
ncbi:MAG: thioredoxin [Bacteroidetes bacterium]|nr:thioredoxin [Bacteroidota bacterium]